MRGIIMCAPTTVSENGAFGLSAELDSQLLHSWLLFWDKLDMPRLRSGLVVETPAGEFLTAQGILETTTLWPEARLTDGDVLTWPLFEAFKIRNRRAPGCWSLAMGEGALNVPASLYASGPGLEVRLTRALPVPDKEVPLEDILRFRARRGPQLKALWQAIDDIAKQYQDDPRRPLAEQAAVGKFAREALEAIAVTREAGLRFRLFDVAARYSTTVALGASLPIAFGSSIPEIVGNGILAAGGLLVADCAGMTGQQLTDGPFAYVLGYHTDVFGDLADD